MAEQHDARQWPAQTARLAEIFASKPRAHWQAHFAGSEACTAVVLSPWEAEQDPHMQDRGTWSAGKPHLQAAPAPRFDGARLPINDAPLRDQDRSAILTELGLG